jgi:hypothetical protein
MKILSVCRAASVVLVGLAAQTASAQNSTPPDAGAPSGVLAATGKVVGPDQEPQAGVPVLVEGPMGKTHAFTDAKGNWSLYNLAPGKYQVKPASGTANDVNEPVAFTVKEKGFFDKLFGSDKSAVLAAEIKLDKDFKQ